MNCTVVQADANVLTKIIVISPKYVLVNQMKSSIEVAQINTQYSETGRIFMDVGDRREWVWSDTSKESLICVRRTGFEDNSYIYGSSEDEDDDDDNEEDSVRERFVVRSRGLEDSTRVFEKDGDTDSEESEDDDKF